MPRGTHGTRAGRAPAARGRGGARRPGSGGATPGGPASFDPAEIDALYGLEPVIEPDAPAVGDGATPWIALECPYCWEHYDTQLDLSAGSTSYVEDCQVCCRPIQVSVEVDDAGALRSARGERMD